MRIEYWLYTVPLRLRSLFRRRRVEEELRDELQYHVEQKTRQYAAEGMTEDEARRAALRDMDGLEQHKEECRDMRRVNFIDDLLKDLRFGLRQLRRNPGFTAVAVITLALGIGANTAIFSVVNAVLLRPLPYQSPNHLVMLYEGLKGFSNKVPFSAPDFEFLVEHSRSYCGVAAYQEQKYELSGSGRPERITGARVSAALFAVLGVEPVFGRTFSVEEDKDGRSVVVLSYRLWRSEFEGRADILGKVIDINRKPHIVVGVMPRRFTFPNRGMAFYDVPAAFYVPMSFTRSELQGYGTGYDSSVVARLRPGVGLVQARAEAHALAQRIESQYPALIRRDPRMTLSATVASMREEVVGPVETLLLVLLGAVGLVVLIACIDVASLLLARAATRDRELAVRMAMGASRLRLVRQLLTESVLLGLAGGAVGLLIAFWGTGVIVSLAPSSLPFAERIGVDGRVLSFTVLLSVVTAVIFGAAPSLAASRLNISEDLKKSGRSGTSGLRQRRMLRGFVTAQFALTLILLAGAGLLFRSFTRMLETNPGFEPEHIVSVSVSLPAQAYRTATEIRTFYKRLLAGVQALPGVQAAALGTALPMEYGERLVLTPQSASNFHTGEFTPVDHVWVLGDYFGVLGIPLVKGRYFSQDDRQGAETVVIINEALARRYWPDHDPIGQRIKWGISQSRSPWLTVVGVVGNVKQASVSVPVMAQAYTPYVQEPDEHIEHSFRDDLRSLSLVVRAEGRAGAVVSAIRGQINRLDPALPMYNVQTMDQLIDTTVGPEQFNTLLMGIFAILALALAAIGIYGVVSYSVRERTHEIGIRLALGAQKSDVVSLVVGQGMTLTLVGVGIGIAGALGLTRFLSSLLYGVKPTDPLTFTAVSLLLICVALVACYMPAGRAARVDPMVALRHE
jgi:predicted permease